MGKDEYASQERKSFENDGYRQESAEPGTADNPLQ